MPGDKDETPAVRYGVRHEVRRQILRALRDQADGEVFSPRRLAVRFAMPLSNVNYHVQILTECGMVRLADRQPGCGSIEIFYEVTELVEHPVAGAALATEPD